MDKTAYVILRIAILVVIIHLTSIEKRLSPGKLYPKSINIPRQVSFHFRQSKRMQAART